MDETSDNLKNIKRDITRDSTEFEKYYIISTAINEWIENH
jgi:hypothetical protein